VSRTPRRRGGLAAFGARAALALSLALAPAALRAEAPPAGAEPFDVGTVPELLRPWIAWVLARQPDRACPFLNGSTQHRCAWPGALELQVDGSGARFRQPWEVDGVGAWVPLPGDGQLWPDGVKAGERPIAVVPLGGGAPNVWLPAGRHVLEGQLRWSEVPSLLSIPAETGLVALTRDGRAVAQAERDEHGRLWLGERPTAPAPEDHLAFSVFRRVDDGVPLELETRLDLRLSGRAREALLGPVLPAGFAPLALSSPIPARLEDDGRLRVQLRPGRWQIELRARHEGPAAELAPPAAPDWPAEEVWVFDARPEQRIVSVEGVAPVDPNQTDLPDPWRRLPAYVVRAGEQMRLVERRRGDPDPTDHLSLDRTLWLDFDGGGLTFHDRIRGALRRSSRLEMPAPAELGRASVNGSAWFLTRLAESGPVGVEVSPGSLALDADGRIASGRAFAAVSWAHDFDRVEGQLLLPPGWRLLHASGVDRASQTWIGGWTLLDLFLVLIGAAAAARLWGAAAGAVALAALALTWSEPGAPRLVWLAAFAGEALVRVLHTRRLALAARAARLAAWAALALAAVPFLVGELQRGLHPSLAPPAAAAADVLGRIEAKSAALPAQSDQAQPPRAAAPVPTAGALGRERALAKAPATPQAEPEREAREEAPAERAPDLRALDPNARIATGPGLPRWAWSTVALVWSGPVEADQRVRLWLVSPGGNRALAFARLALVAALGFVVLGRGRREPGAPTLSRFPAAPLVAFALLAGGAAASADLPSKALLDELQARLAKPPACHPACASIARLAVELDEGRLRLRLEAHAAASTAIPLPGGAASWRPQSAAVDAVAVSVLRDGGTLWLPLAPGVHDVLLEGRLAPGIERIELPLPLRPHRVSVDAPGWSVHGLDLEGGASGALELRRSASAGEGAAPALAPEPPPFFATVERTIRLGVTWNVDTRVARISEPGRASVLEVPLLEGEAVATEGIPAADGTARLRFAPDTRSISWSSTLEPRGEIRLTAPASVAWVETWRLDAQPLWHVDADGIPPLAAPDDRAALRAWRPWPGESVALRIARPIGAGGATLTIDSAVLDLHPGRRSTDAALALELRASQGGRHAISLPPGAELRAVRIDGTEQPLRADGRELSLPLRPGEQGIEVEWRSAEGMGLRTATPDVSLGAPAVNVTESIAVPEDRWVLSVGGPRLGPAVLFWGVLVVLAVVAAGLARAPGVPLRFHHWLLLGLGLTQVPVWFGAAVAGWFVALAWRREHGAQLAARSFAALQILLVLWSAVALAALFDAIRHGLLGAPEMQIAGNGSTAYALRWYQDRTEGKLPVASVISVPIAVYRAAMLAWALWLARALLGWLRWGFDSWSAGGMWRPLRARTQGA